MLAVTVSAAVQQQQGRDSSSSRGHCGRSALHLRAQSVRTKQQKMCCARRVAAMAAKQQEASCKLLLDALPHHSLSLTCVGRRRG